MTIKDPQKILVLQQNGSGRGKVRGIRLYGEGAFEIELFEAPVNLPEFLEDPEEHLPKAIEADLVLDFLKHPDLSLELAYECSRKLIPLVASGKKWRVPEIHTPPT